jgi:hypothetical protein
MLYGLGQPNGSRASAVSPLHVPTLTQSIQYEYLVVTLHLPSLIQMTPLRMGGTDGLIYYQHSEITAFSLLTPPFSSLTLQCTSSLAYR